MGRFPRRNGKPAVVSLFSGAGGLDRGFEDAGFDVRLAIDVNSDAIDSYNHNRQHHHPARGHVADVRDLTLTELDRLAGETVEPIGIIGGPPCQSFSQGNRSPVEGDHRHALPLRYAELISSLNERHPVGFFVFENVTGLRSTEHIDRFVEMLEAFDDAGFSCREAILDAARYGVPQRRRRLIVVGFNRQLYPGKLWEVPNVQTPEPKSVRNAIGELPDPVHYSRGLSARDIPHHPNHWCMAPKSWRFFEEGALLPGQTGSRSFKTLAWNEPSITVAYGNREVHVHPGGKRRLSVYEGMKLQGFPDEYELVGSLSAQITQVSEAVPPPLGRAIAQSIYTQLGLGATTVAS